MFLFIPATHIRVSVRWPALSKLSGSQNRLDEVLFHHTGHKHRPDASPVKDFAAFRALSQVLFFLQAEAVHIRRLSCCRSAHPSRRSIGFGALPIPGALYTLTDNPYFLVGVQLMDGIGAAIFGVVSVLVIADLTRGTGRFNFTQGVVATATGLGASLSNGITGFIVQRAGFNTAFLFLAGVATFAFPCFGSSCRRQKRSGTLVTLM